LVPESKTRPSPLRACNNNSGDGSGTAHGDIRRQQRSNGRMQDTKRTQHADPQPPGRDGTRSEQTPVFFSQTEAISSLIGTIGKGLISEREHGRKKLFFWHHRIVMRGLPPSVPTLLRLAAAPPSASSPRRSRRGPSCNCRRFCRVAIGSCRRRCCQTR
jgi:hypothetical protein